MITSPSRTLHLATDRRAPSSWRRELQAAITDPVAALTELGWPVPDAAGLREVARRYSVRIPRYYFDLIDPADPQDPIALQCLPSLQEVAPSPGDLDDAVGDLARSPVPGIVHKYQGRAILLVANSCSMYCRFCFRKPVPQGLSRDGLREGLSSAFEWLERSEQIEEVILSGGDPLVLDNAALASLLTRLRAIPHIQTVRIHSRVPVTLPSRIDPPLAELLGQHRPLRVMTHFNHPRELTPQARAGVDVLLRHGVVVLNQAVLLRGINNDVEVLRALFSGLYRWGVTPWYLHHCDRTKGTEPFRLPLREGMALMAALKPLLSGPALPRYVLDVPGGHGKMPITADYFEEREPGRWRVKVQSGEVEYLDVMP